MIFTMYNVEDKRQDWEFWQKTRNYKEETNENSRAENVKSKVKSIEDLIAY